MNFDFTIIGGSFAGMTSALALSNASPDLKIAIIEKQDILRVDRKRDGRAYAISSTSLKLFKKIGIFDKLQDEAGIISDIKITDYKSPLFLDFLKRETGGDLGQIIENYQIHNALRDQILQRKNISVFAPNSACEVVPNLLKSDLDETCFDKLGMTRVTLDNGEKIYSKLLLACDGRFSKLREMFQIHTTVKKYGQTAIVFNVEHELSHQNMAARSQFCR
jgi:2-octaprenyl-6-methoxyphenol hydroxylase